MPETPDLERFVAAQAPVIDQVMAELRAGRKRTHWMWFVFPQLRELGRSAMARTYGLESGAEAAAYLAHPVLGARLRACVETLLALPPASANAIFGSPDDLKLRSCLTLFDSVAAGDDLFQRAIARYYAGEPDPATLALLRSPSHPV